MALVLRLRCNNGRDGAVRNAWRYENVDTGMVGILYDCRGQISWQHGGSCADYHGEFTQ